MSVWVLRRSYQCAPWGDDAARLVIHCSPHLWCDHHAILNAFCCACGRRSPFRSSFQDDSWSHSFRKAHREPLRKSPEVLLLCPLFRRVHFSQFSMWSHDVVLTSIYLSGDLKLGQYLKVFVVF